MKIDRERIYSNRDPVNADRESVETCREGVRMHRECVLNRVIAAFTLQSTECAMLDHQAEILHDFDAGFGERFGDFRVVNSRLHPDGFRLFRENFFGVFCNIIRAAKDIDEIDLAGNIR